jgi:nucleoside-diphosphate kinase
MERTLLIIKPDGVKRKLIGEVIHRVEKEDFDIISLQMLSLSRKTAERLYAVHKGKPFYEPLVEFMITGPIVVALLQADNAIKRLRNIVGKTDPKEAKTGTIRADFGTTIRKNVVHAPDSRDSFFKEYKILFQ